MSFVPRLTDNGIMNNPKWYSENPFYLAGYGLPNCTAYAWRKILGGKQSKLARYVK